MELIPPSDHAAFALMRAAELALRRIVWSSFGSGFRHRAAAWTFIAGFGLATTGEAGQIVNVATRVAVGGVAGTPIPGFVLGGTGTKSMLLRAVGPTLAGFGVGGVLADPRLTLSKETSDNLQPVRAFFCLVPLGGLAQQPAGRKGLCNKGRSGRWSLAPGPAACAAASPDSRVGGAKMTIY